MTGRLDALEADVVRTVENRWNGSGRVGLDFSDRRDAQVAEIHAAFAELRRARELRAAMLAAIPYRVATCAYHRRANEAAVGALAMGWLSE